MERPVRGDAVHERFLQFSQHQLRLPAGKRRSQYGARPRDYISATGGSNSLLNPDLKQNKNYETSVRLDRQLVPNVGVGFGYIYNRHANWYGSVGGSNTATA